MGRSLVKTLVVLGFALAFFNLYCFAHCLAQSCDASAMPCHSQSHSKSDQCPDRHDVKIATVNAFEGCVATHANEWIETSVISTEYCADSPDSNAPLPDGSSAFRPLRV